MDERGRAARSCGRFPNLWWLACDHLGPARAFPDTFPFGGYKYGGLRMGKLGRVDWASGAALLIPAAVWRRVGGLDENIFMYMEEVDWCRRAAAAGLAVRYVPDAPVLHLGGMSSRQMAGDTYLHNLRSRLYYFRKHFGPAAALAAKGILALSLACKWLVAIVPRSRRAFARVYATGLATVWAATWR
jgi:GT2 family glycosyltransferase